MNERKWLACKKPATMLAQLQGKVSARKLRLLGVARSRSVYHLLSDKRSRKAVEVAERFAEGKATQKQLRAAEESAAVPGGRAKRPASEQQISRRGCRAGRIALSLSLV